MLLSLLVHLTYLRRYLSDSTTLYKFLKFTRNIYRYFFQVKNTMDKNTKLTM
jgi:hypothetical protein